MAKKQEIITKLSADSKELNNALDTARTKLRQTSKDAEKTAKSVDKAVKASKSAGGVGNIIGKSVGQAVGQTVGKSVGNAAAQGMAQAIGGGGVVSPALSVAAGIALGGVAKKVSGWLAGAAQKFGDRIQEALDIVKGADESAGGDTTLFQQMRTASKKTGTSINDLSSAYKKFTETLESAKNGSADAIDALAKLGLQTSDLSENTGEAFAQAAQALGDMGRSSQSAAAAIAVFGTETGKVRDALAYLGDNRDDLSGIIGDDAVDAATRVAKQWEAVKTVFDEMEDMAIGWTDNMLTGAQNWLADILEGVAALAKSGGDSVSADEFQAELQASRDRAEQRRKAQEAAKAAREEEARRRRNAEAEKKTAQYQDQQQRDDLKRANQRKKTMEEYNLAGMSEQERRLYNRRKYSNDLVSLGFSPDEAERITRRLYDAQFRGKTASQANPERERERWKQDYMRRYGVSANVAEDAARKTYDYRQQEQPPAALEVPRIMPAISAPTMPTMLNIAQSLSQILTALESLKANTYVVE